MAAYVISEVEVINEAAAEHYKQHAAASIAIYGGRYLARGAEPWVAEGEAAKGRIVIVEFPSMEKAREWFASPEYAKAIKFHNKALRRRLMFIEER